MSASSAGGTILWADRTEKLSSFDPGRPQTMAAAMVGAVVSNPTPRNTTCRSGFCWASATASTVEYTMRMSRPSARSRCRDEALPGTRMRSPKVATMTSFCRASSMKASISAWSVTHTGQPGPDRREMVSGSTERIPLRKMDTVWVPQTSIRRIWPPAGALDLLGELPGQARVPVFLAVLDRHKPPRGNSKHEIRNPKQKKFQNAQTHSGAASFWISVLRFAFHCFEFRYSNFGSLTLDLTRAITACPSAMPPSLVGTSRWL